MSTQSLFEVQNLEKSYPVRDAGFLAGMFGTQKRLRAVDGISFRINEGEILGVAGQSGCGKSTLGELLVRLQEATDGEIRFRGDDITAYSRKELSEFRQQCQIIFQDPYESLNPRFTVAQTVTEPLAINDIGSPEDRDAIAANALEDAGLYPVEQYLDKLPTQLSGGERQRVSIARALALDPDFIVADEPVSMLDVSVRTEILHLFRKLQRERDLTMVYISHDLSTINYLSDQTMIMFLGDIMEIGPTEEVIQNPAHPYSEALLDSMPSPNPANRSVDAGLETDRGVESDIPDPIDLPSGCRYEPWCQYSSEKCSKSEPDLETKSEHIPRKAACYHPIDE